MEGRKPKQTCSQSASKGVSANVRDCAQCTGRSLADPDSSDDRKRNMEKRKTYAERKKAYDQARSRTRVNIGSAFTRWKELGEREGLGSDAEVALFLLDL